MSVVRCSRNVRFADRCENLDPLSSQQGPLSETLPSRPLKKGTGSEQDTIVLAEFKCRRGACPLFQHAVSWLERVTHRLYPDLLRGPGWRQR